MASKKQVGGDHYQGFTQQHWEYCYERRFDCFQYIITKWVERWRKKGGLEDLKKARHALDAYIELVEAGHTEGEPGPGYIDQ